jgi:hypothetical protein
MSETLGSLCDKITIIKLKQFHSKNRDRLAILSKQEKHLINEINQYVSDACKKLIPRNQLTFASNKIYKKVSINSQLFKGSIGQIICKLAEVNCDLWHEQEKVYEFEKVPLSEKDQVINKIATLNLERNLCIDEINIEFKKLVSIKSKNNYTI